MPVVAGGSVLNIDSSRFPWIMKESFPASANPKPSKITNQVTISCFKVHGFFGYFFSFFLLSTGGPFAAPQSASSSSPHFSDLVKHFKKEITDIPKHTVDSCRQ